MTVGVVTIGPWTSPAPGATPPTQSNNIKLTNLTGVKWLIRYARTVTITGGDWSAGNGRCEIAPIQPWDGYNVSSDILVSGGFYHDFGPSTPSVHTEGILIYGANGVTIRGSSFARNGGTGDIGLFFVDAPTVSASDYIVLANITIENIQGSSFWRPSPDVYDAYFNMQISNQPAIPGLKLSNNTLPKNTVSNGAPYVAGINYFSRAVPGGTPKAVAPPAGWGR